MPYRAGAGGGLFGSNVYGDTRPKVDVGGAIDAITNTGLSLVQSAYNRRMQQAELERANRAEARQGQLDRQANEDRAFQRQRQTSQDQLARDTFDETKRQHTLSLIEKGYHEDAHTNELPNVPGMTQLPAFAGSAPSTITYESQPAGPHFDVDRSLPFRLDQAKGSLTEQAYLGMGMTAAQARAARMNPSIADNIMTPPAPHVVQGDNGTYALGRDGKTTEVRTPDGHAIPRRVGAGAGTAEKRLQATTLNSILDDYHRDAADFEKARGGYEVLKGALANPGIATPFSVLDAYARVVNPGAVVRQGTMQTLKEMGSVDQKVARWFSMAQKGEWPPEMISDVKKTIDGIMREHYQTYKGNAQQRALRRGQVSGIDVSPYMMAPMTEFEEPAAAPAGGTTPPAAASSGDINLAGAAPAPAARVGAGVRKAQQQKDYDAAAAALKKTGKSDAEILKEIGARP